MFRNRGLGGKILSIKTPDTCEILVMNISDCFEHDINTRNVWVELMPADMAAKIRVIAQPARRALYADLDAKVKAKYLEKLRELNKDLIVVQLKGFGPLRQSTKQTPLGPLLSSVAQDVLIESGFIVSN